VVRRVLAVALGVGVALGGAELLLRALHIPFEERWTPSENSIGRFDPLRGWAYRANLSREVPFETGARPVHFDANGIRVPSPETVLEPTAPSILFVGGSYTMGHGLAYEESFVGQFAAFEEVRPWQVLNLGVQGYGTDQAFLTMQQFVPRFDTRIVVYTFIPSHVRRNANYDRRLLFPKARFLGTKPRFALDADGRPYLARLPVRYEDYRHSYLVDLVKIAWGAHRKGRVPSREAVELTRALVRAMGEYCAERGVHFLLVDWRWRPSDPAIFEGLGVPVLDTLEDAPPGWEHMRLRGEDHPNARASRHVAELLRARLLEEGWLGER